MKLITKQLQKELAKYPLYSQDGKVEDAVVVCKFFLQGYTWYVLEAEKADNGYEFFGIIVGQHTEYGYFTLSQLESVTGQWGMRVERDRGFKPTKVKDLHLDIV
jgi:hypothetical protein